MVVGQIFNAQGALNNLMTQTVHLIRMSNQVRTMKSLIHCYDILELTNEINKPWDQPGRIKGDMAAFVDLEVTCQDLIIKRDPSPQLVSDYVFEITKFVFFWKKGEENHLLIKVSTSSGG